MVDYEEVYALANRAIEDGSLVAMLTRGTSPLMDAWRELQAKREKDRLGVKIAWEDTPIGQAISMGEGSYITPETIIQTSREIAGQYAPRSSFMEWIKQQRDRSHTQFKKPFDGYTEAAPNPDALGGYLVPQQYVDQLLSFDFKQAIERTMVRRISQAIDEEFLYGRMLTAVEATQRVSDDPDEAFLDAALNRKRPTLGYDKDYDRFPEGRSRYKLRGNSVAILGSDGDIRGEYDCREVEFEYKVGAQQFSLMGVMEPIRRVIGHEISGTLVLSSKAANEMLRQMDNNAPLSGVRFSFDMGDKRVEFNGGISEFRHRPMTLWGLPVYITDDFGNPDSRLTPMPDEEQPCDVKFVAYGPVQVTSKNGFEYGMSQYDFARQRQQFWKGPYDDTHREVIKQIDMYHDRPAEYTVEARPIDRKQVEADVEDWVDEMAQDM